MSKLHDAHNISDTGAATKKKLRKKELNRDVGTTNPEWVGSDFNHKEVELDRAVGTTDQSMFGLTKKQRQIVVSQALISVL